MKRYPEYKESGVDWIGEIPAHWEIGKIKYIATLVSRKSTPETNAIKISAENVESETGKVLNFYSSYDSDGVKFQVGDVLFNKLRVYLNKVVFAEYRGYSLGQMIVIRPSLQNIGKHLFYLMSSCRFIEYCNSMSHGATMPQTNASDILNAKIPITPYQEQTQIANFLDHKTEKIDELIRIKERQVELLHEYRASLIQQTVTKGLDPNVEMKPSGVDQIGEIPAHWEVKPVKHIALFIGGYSEFGSESYTDSGIPIFRIGDITQSIKMEKVKRVPIQQVKRLQQNQLCHGDTLIVMIGRRAGESTYYAFDYPSILSAQVAGLRATKVDSKFLFYFIHSASFLHTVTPLFFGATRDNISKTALMGVKIPFPPNSEQKEIATFLDRKTGQIDKLIALEGRKIELLKEYRQSLISHVVTGKIDVRNEV